MDELMNSESLAELVNSEILAKQRKLGKYADTTAVGKGDSMCEAQVNLRYAKLIEEMSQLWPYQISYTCRERHLRGMRQKLGFPPVIIANQAALT